MRNIIKKKVGELQINPRIKEVLLQVLGPDEDVYVESTGKGVRIIL
ncbi:hypothetical protein Pogu_0879 [Pyrobaculum oguniense TE7]|uniref:Uncharacterized protein n=1 Tax=Pyrobaculum oguniense (strain DSM 13380 / JCM 10595 / TE7) TaxID=698757 RepID=H6Q9S1_PYROT|nr:hypothetical protein Pogu_0879 [Pyrobaculum oguniense TE7]